MAARAYSGKKPKNLKHTLRVFLSYLGRHKKMLAVVAVLVTISAGANLFGTYMIRPVSTDWRTEMCTHCCAAC